MERSAKKARRDEGAVAMVDDAGIGKVPETCNNTEPGRQYLYRAISTADEQAVHLVRARWAPVGTAVADGCRAIQCPVCFGICSSNGQKNATRRYAVLHTQAVPGLRMITGYLTDAEQACVLARVDQDYLDAGPDDEHESNGGPAPTREGTEAPAPTAAINQAMVFGDQKFPPWLHRLLAPLTLLPGLLSDLAPTSVSRPTAAPAPATGVPPNADALEGTAVDCTHTPTSSELSRRRPLFNQMIINEYW